MEGKRILLIEDEPDLQEALKDALEGEGYTVIAYSESESALTDFENIKPDLAIVDLFTGSIFGTHFIERVKAHPLGVGVKFIVLTNNSNEMQQKKAAALGAEAYLVKVDTPIAKVLETVKETLAA